MEPALSKCLVMGFPLLWLKGMAASTMLLLILLLCGMREALPLPQEKLQNFTRVCLVLGFFILPHIAFNSDGAVYEQFSRPRWNFSPVSYFRLFCK